MTLVFSVADSSTLVSVDADPDIAGMRTGAKGHQSEMTFTALDWKRSSKLRSDLDEHPHQHGDGDGQHLGEGREQGELHRQDRVAERDALAGEQDTE